MEATTFIFPIMIISEQAPLLKKGDQVFAYSYKATSSNNQLDVELIENKGLDLSGYLGKPMECLLEITKGEILYSNEPALEGLKVKYQWKKRLFEYFLNLDKTTSENDRDSDSSDAVVKDEESEIVELYTKWGLNGFQLEAYQDKPVFSSSLGNIFLNEYVFEEELEQLELGQEVEIDIKEVFLRGIRPLRESL